MAYGPGTGYGLPAYSAEGSAPTAAYPPVSTPSYAPTGYAQPQYASPGQLGYPPTPDQVAVRTRSRATAGLLSALIGFILVAGGVYLVAKYGFAAGRYQTETLKTSGKDLGLAAGGGGLLLAAVILNGWSPWATLIPGLVLAGLGGWAFASPSGLVRVTKLSNFLFKNQEMQTWHLVGFTLVLGAVLVAASAASAIARMAGRRSAAAEASR